MAFEDLLRPASPACKTCAFIEQFDEKTRAEVDIAMTKAKYGDRTLARGLKALAVEGQTAPGESTVHIHRTKGHRVPS